MRPFRRTRSRSSGGRSSASPAPTPNGSDGRSNTSSSTRSRTTSGSRTSGWSSSASTDVSRAAVVLGTLTLALVAGCGGGGSTVRPRSETSAGPVSDPCRGVAPPPRYDHVVVVVLENHPFADIAGHSPYLNGLARDCGLATGYSAVAHPSLPNYLALTAGSTHGITSDCTGRSVSAPSLFGQ